MARRSVRGRPPAEGGLASITSRKAVFLALEGPAIAIK